MEAFRLSRSNDQFDWWWNWWPSWIVAGGPLGRYGGGVVLGWKELDRRDGGGLFRLSSGVLIAVGMGLTCIAGVSVISMSVSGTKQAKGIGIYHHPPNT
jgi:hypothetical protein